MRRFVIDEGAVTQNGAFFYSIGATAMIVSETLPASAEATPGSATASVAPEADPWSPDQLPEVDRQERETLRRIAATFGSASVSPPKTESPTISSYDVSPHAGLVANCGTKRPVDYRSIFLSFLLPEAHA